MKMWKKLMSKYMKEVVDGADGGDAGGGQATKTQAPADTSLLGGDNTPGENWLPEKYRVTGADGALDLAASSRKMAEGYTALEKRVGTGELPPKTPEEYSVKLEGVDDEQLQDIMSDPAMGGFLKGAHAKGLTNDQVGYVLGEYLKVAPQLTEGAQQLDQQAATDELRKEWTTDVAFSENLSLAQSAFKAFAPAADQDRINEIGNNPIVIRLLANIGKEMQEDSPAGNPIAAAVSTDIASLMRSEAYTNDKHPDHARVTEQVRRHYERRYGNKPM